MVQSTWSMMPPAVADQLGGVGEETIRGGASPLRVGRREMLADIAEPGGAEQGVGDGVEHDVGVAVARRGRGRAGLRCRRASPARRRRSRERRSPCRCASTSRAASIASARSQSAGVVSLSSAGSPATAATLSPAARATVASSVGGVAVPAVIGAAQGVDGGRPGGSGRGPAPARSIGSPRSSPAPGQRVADRQAPARRRRGCPARRAADRRPPAGRRGGRRRGPAPASPPIAARPARTESARCAPPRISCADVEALQARRAPAPPGRADHYPHRVDRAGGGQRFDRPAQDRLAAERAELLGHAAAHAFPASGGDDQCGDASSAIGARLARQPALL